LDRDRFGAEPLERPTLAPSGAGGPTPGSKHWRIEADEPAGLQDAQAGTVFGGDELTGEEPRVSTVMARAGP